ncbi:MAG TPA: MBL fold metallo-hydrolase [Dehalococcoidia bacterium]|jgi:glyoxylase-like metal-dependent hydrolase (beta-lactamase superfamily II)|nr:MBL fold metallo-hydrolase [Dehalococcoidia bacterium]
MTSPKITVGNVEIISLVDMVMEVPWQVFFPQQSESAFEAYHDLYPGSVSDGKFRAQVGCYVIRSQGRTILCDTGVGPGPISFLGGLRGRLLDDIREKGVRPEDVDMVFFTHLHGDHVGWNLSPDGTPNFSKARHLVPQADWDYFSSMLETNQQMQQVVPLEALGVMELVSGERALTSEVTTYPTPGHTPGHTSLLISSSGERAIVTGDLAHHPAQVNHTDWCSSFDTNAAETSATRQQVFDRMEADSLIAAFSHFPDPFGKLARLEGKRVFQAL